MEKTQKPLRKFGEGAWIAGLIVLALGTALAAKADFGVSMVVAPAYVISEKTPLTFGMAEWIYQGLLMGALCIAIGRFRISMLLSFGTSFLYGLALDFWNLVVFKNLAAGSLPVRIALLALSLICVSLGVTLFFMSYLPAQICDMFVKETSEKYKLNRSKVKYAFDAASLALALLLSLILFGGVWGHGIGIGTIAATLLNGLLIALFTRLLGKFIDFSPLIKPLYKWLGNSGGHEGESGKDNNGMDD